MKVTDESQKSEIKAAVTDHIISSSSCMTNGIATARLCYSHL